MIYVSTITTVESTLKTAPLRTNKKASGGVVYLVEVYFPPGSSGLMGVQIWNQDVALYPLARNEWFIGDNTTIRFEDIRELSIAENIIEINTYNTDTVYDHVTQVRIGILPIDLYNERYGVGAAILEANERQIEAIQSAKPTPFNAPFDVVREIADTGE